MMYHMYPELRACICKLRACIHTHTHMCTFFESDIYMWGYLYYHMLPFLGDNDPFASYFDVQTFTGVLIYSHGYVLGLSEHMVPFQD